MGDKRVPENIFFLDKKGEVQFYKDCIKCKKDCKQSYKITGLHCNKFEKNKV
jgi:hypothetical protein